MKDNTIVEIVGNTLIEAKLLDQLTPEKTAMATRAIKTVRTNPEALGVTLDLINQTRKTGYWDYNVPWIHAGLRPGTPAGGSTRPRGLLSLRARPRPGSREATRCHISFWTPGEWKGGKRNMPAGGQVYQLFPSSPRLGLQPLHITG